MINKNYGKGYQKTPIHIKCSTNKTMVLYIIRQHLYHSYNFLSMLNLTACKPWTNEINKIKNQIKNAYFEFDGKALAHPKDVSTLLAKLVTTNQSVINGVYDPTSDSANLLLAVNEERKNGLVINGKFYGQTKETKYLGQMNMLANGFNAFDFSIESGDVLMHPAHLKEKPFDAIISYPPYSTSWVGDGDPTLINDPRFAPAGRLAPKSYADFAYVLHCLDHLSDTGRAVIVCHPGILFRKGAEKTIRQYLIKQNFVDAIILLPGQLFSYTSSNLAILVLEKSKTTSHVLFIDARDEFQPNTNKSSRKFNVLTEDNIAKIIEKYKNRDDENCFSKVVTIENLAKSNYDLNFSNYIDYSNFASIIVQIEKEILPIETELKNLQVKIESLTKKLQEPKNKIDFYREKINWWNQWNNSK